MKAQRTARRSALLIARTISKLTALLYFFIGVIHVVNNDAQKQ